MATVSPDIIDHSRDRNTGCRPRVRATRDVRADVEESLCDAFGVYADPEVGAFMRAVALRTRR